MNRGLQAAGLPVPASYHKLTLTVLTVTHLVSFKSVLKSMSFSDVFFKLFVFFPVTGEPTALKTFPSDLLCYFYMDAKVIALVSSRSCLFFWCSRYLLRFSFSFLFNKDLDSQWWSFSVSDHDTSTEHTSTTVRDNTGGFFKEVPGYFLRSVHPQSYLSYCFPKQLNWLIQCYMPIIF